ncbi:hypothetical protein [Legionella geestiana]|nr:hypothetical protein [Legionella geestiana]QBS12299.1 hypothetical protein E4T54_05805 [Legionella geestiana]QDQ39990.1 hypothetical protein E3226_006055 [Legionella geestiana]
MLKFFQKKLLPVSLEEPFAAAMQLIHALLACKGDPAALHEKIVPVDGALLRCTLSVIARDLAVLHNAISKLYENACHMLPQMDPHAVCDFLHEQALNGDTLSATGEARVLKGCALILAELDAVSMRHITVGNAINRQLMALGCQHDRESLLPPDTPGYLFPGNQKVRFASMYNTLPAPEAPGM